MRTELRLLACSILIICVITGSSPAIHAASGSATIRWTAPGDDSLVGRASTYDLRLSLAPITVANYLNATRVSGLPAPQPAGSAESFTITNLVAGTGYYFALKTGDEVANWSAMSNVLYFKVATADARSQPLVAWLSPPSPNPARASARWLYSLPEQGPVEIVAYDIAGRRVRSIANGRMAAGQGDATWDLKDDDNRPVAPGVYLIRATLGGTTTTNRLVVTH